MFKVNTKISFVLIIFLMVFVIPCISAAETVQYSQSGENMSSDRFVASDFTITSERPEIYPGDTLEMSYVITSEGFYDGMISLPKGLYFTALDPDGNLVEAGKAFTGQFISPGDSIIMKARLTVDKPGTWKIWPSYNIQNNNGIVKYNPDEWAAADIYVEEEDIPLADLTIVEAGTAGTAETSDGMKFYYIVKNTGPLDANATMSSILLNNEDTGIGNPVGNLPAGESQKVFFTLSNVSKGDKITIVLDAAGTEDELDEENNDWSFAVNLKNDVSKTSYSEDSSDVVPEEPDQSSNETSSVVYYPATTAVCCDVTAQFIILGIIAVLMSVFSFALGYYYCQSKKCENELGWMYAKLKRLEAGETIDHSYIKAEEVLPDEDIAEAEVVLKGKSGKEDSGDKEKPSEEKNEESADAGSDDKEEKKE
jgi:hypothetical protein